MHHKKKHDVKYILFPLFCPSLNDSFIFPISFPFLSSYKLDNEIGIIYYAFVSLFIRV